MTPCRVVCNRYAGSVLDRLGSVQFLESLDQLGRPGKRVPHVWLQWQEKRISLLDLLGKHFVLLCGEEGQEWYEAAQAAEARWGSHCQAIVLAGERTSSIWRSVGMRPMASLHKEWS